MAGLVGVLAGLLGGLAAPAGPASAHAALVSTNPTQGSVVGGPRTEVVLTFSESVQPVRGRIRVLAPDGERIDTGEPAVSGAVVTVPLRTADEPLGTYLVTYRVISADGHPVAGSFTFSAGAPSPPPTEPPADAIDPVVAVAVSVAKFAGYAGLVLLIGPLLMLARLWPPRLSRTGPARLAWVGAGLVGVSTVVSFWLHAPYTTGGSWVGVSVADVRDVLGSRFGIALLARLVILAVVLGLARAVIRDRGARAPRLWLAVLAVAGLVTWPLSGHPAASPLPAVTILTDTIHAASMAVWLGGLVVLGGFLLRRADDEELDGLLPTWSRWAALAVCWLALSGAVQAVVEIASVGALLGTRYGWLVLAKLGLLGGVLVVAAYSRRMVRRLAGRSRRLRMSVLVEVGLTAVVLAVTAVLVQTTPARTATGEAEQAQLEGFATTLRSPRFTVQFDVFPVQLGQHNTLHVYVYTPDGRTQRVVEWRVSAALPARGIEPIATPVLPIRDNHAVGAVNFVAPGDWQLRFTLRISEIDQATVTATVPVRAV
ncbi:MAG TPA: copper resistance protein CopC [Pilimelia sp.]|nr:copper resistance protein CopC [Pilimelia sp.]